MKNYYKLTLGLGLFFLAGCMPQSIPPSYPPGGHQQNPYYQTNQYSVQPGYQQPAYSPPQQPAPQPPRDDNYYDNKINQDEDRDEVLEESRRRRRGDKCEDESSRHQCRTDCREMYRGDRDECEELTVSQINVLIEDVYPLLKDPSPSNLRDIDLKDLEVFLNVSIRGFHDLIREYDRGDAEDVLLFLAEDEEAAALVRDEDEDLRSLEDLISRARLGSDTERRFTTELDREGTLFEAAADYRNEEAVDWFLDYIFHSESVCGRDGEDKTSLACWTIICKIGDEISAREGDRDSIRERLLRVEAFEDYVDDIIDAKTNGWDGTGNQGSKWCAEGSEDDAPCSANEARDVIEGVDDLDNLTGDDRGEWLALCGGLLS